MTTEIHHDLAVLINKDAGASEMLRIASTSDRVHVISGEGTEDASYFRKLAVMVRATQLDEVADIVSVANKANRLRALLIDSDVDSDWIPYMIERAKLRILRNVLVHHGPEVPKRFLWAWARGIEDQVIANATTFDDCLVVRNCAMRSFEIEFDAYPALTKIPPSSRSHFIVDEDGLFLHWADSDVHLTMEDVLLVHDSTLRRRAQVARIASDRAFGAAVRALRMQHKLTQEDIHGLSPRHVRRIEQGFVPGEEAIFSLAAAHQMDPDEYLDAVTELME